jgi:outer membrane protein
MRQTWLRIVVTALLAVSAGGCAAGNGSPGSGPAAATRVGVVDLQKILLETDAGKKAREALTKYTKDRQSVMEFEAKDLKRMEDDLIKQASVLTPAARKDREDHLRRRIMEFQQKEQDMNREIQEKQKEILDTFRDKVEKAVGRVAQQLGLQLVMERGKGGPTVYNEAGLDISARVIEEFNKGVQ